ncbi:hypothetical protein B0H11DRAFT_2248339 [Mycena galericulata]|nr:hypothetical protein B0H11DRAFT_2248339 [Mycena galericulata]
MIECLRQVIPRVEMLSVWRIRFTPERAGMRALEGMDNLSQLHLRHNPWLRGSDVGQLPQIIEEGKKVLETSKALGRKELRIQHLDEEKLLKETVFILDGDIWSSGAVHYPVVTLSDDY